MWLIINTINSRDLLKNWTKHERFSCYWFLISGAVTHLLCDSFAGLFGLYRPLSILYRMIDTRFLIIES